MSKMLDTKRRHLYAPIWWQIYKYSKEYGRILDHISKNHPLAGKMIFYNLGEINENWTWQGVFLYFWYFLHTNFYIFPDEDNDKWSPKKNCRYAYIHIWENQLLLTEGQGILYENIHPCVYPPPGHYDRKIRKLKGFIITGNKNDFGRKINKSSQLFTRLTTKRV